MGRGWGFFPKSFAALLGSDWIRSSSLLEKLVYGLWRSLMKNVPEIDELTPEYVMRVGQEWIDAIFKATPTEEAMRHYSPAERLAGLSPEQAMRHYSPEERLAGLDEPLFSQVPATASTDLTLRPPAPATPPPVGSRPETPCPPCRIAP